MFCEYQIEETNETMRFLATNDSRARSDTPDLLVAISPHQVCDGDRVCKIAVRRFLNRTATAHSIKPDELKLRVLEIHESLLRSSVLQEIKEKAESLLQELKDSANRVSEENFLVSELVEVHSANYFFGCNPFPFIKQYGPTILSLKDKCLQNDKALKDLERKCHLYFDDNDPLLEEVQRLLRSSRDLSKTGTFFFSHFCRYNSRVKTEFSWFSEFPKSLESCCGQLSIITPKIIDLENAVLEQIQELEKLVPSIENSHDFGSHFSDVHALKRTLDAIEIMSECSAAVKEAIADVSSQRNVLASIYKEKENIAKRFIRWEKVVKDNVLELESPIKKLEVEVNSVKILYAEKFSHLPKDKLVPKIDIDVEHLQDLVTSFCEFNSRRGCNTLDYCLERMVAQGVVTEDAYDLTKENFNSFERYRIKEFEKISTENSKKAIAIIEDGTALIGNFKITTEYCMLGRNDIYDIPDGAVFETNIAGDAYSHCVVIIGFGVTSDGLAYYVFQNSYGPLWGIDGCGRIACSCLKHLYRAKV